MIIDVANGQLVTSGKVVDIFVCKVDAGEQPPEAGGELYPTIELQAHWQPSCV